MLDSSICNITEKRTPTLCGAFKARFSASTEIEVINVHMCNVLSQYCSTDMFDAFINFPSTCIVG